MHAESGYMTRCETGQAHPSGLCIAASMDVICLGPVQAYVGSLVTDRFRFPSRLLKENRNGVVLEEKEIKMKKLFLLLAFLGVLSFGCASQANAGVHVGIGIGVPGYYGPGPYYGGPYYGPYPYYGYYGYPYPYYGYYGHPYYYGYGHYHGYYHGGYRHH
jgi:hypothetical protein